MSNRATFVCFGEVLWDVFPNAKHLGGAPLNVALRLASLCESNSVKIVSAVGQDAHGDEALSIINNTLLDTHLIQQNALATGSVQVSLSQSGNASYQILNEVAWDYIKVANEALESLKKSSIFVFGSLAARSKVSRATLHKLLDSASFSVFDVNLRPPHFRWDELIKLLKKSEFVKMNDQELALICNELGCKEKSIERQLKWLQSVTTAQYLCVTLGAKGACMLHKDSFVTVTATPVKVVDTVGAGDSFLATLLWALFYKQQSIGQALDKACRMGAFVASNAGANPEITQKGLKRLFSD